MTASQEQLAAKGAELLQRSAKHVVLTVESSRLKLQSAAGFTVSEDLKLVAGARERPEKRAKETRRCKEAFAKPSTAAFLALLAERDGFETCCKELTLENQCTLEVAAEAKELHEKVAKHKEIDAAAKTAS